MVAHGIMWATYDAASKQDAVSDGFNTFSKFNSNAEAVPGMLWIANSLTWRIHDQKPYSNQRNTRKGCAHKMLKLPPQIAQNMSRSRGLTSCRATHHARRCVRDLACGLGSCSERTPPFGQYSTNVKTATYDRFPHEHRTLQKDPCHTVRPRSHALCLCLDRGRRKTECKKHGRVIYIVGIALNLTFFGRSC